MQYFRVRCFLAVVAEAVCAVLLASTANAATLTVTTASDEIGSVLSLREAIAQALPGDEINFDPSLAGQTIVLTQGQLTIDKELTVTGPGAFALTIDGNIIHRVLQITNDVTNGKVVSISGVTIANGNEGRPNVGSGVFNEGTLALSNCIVTRNGHNAAAQGSGIANSGTLAINHCTISNNGASDVFNGGGIRNSGTLAIQNSTVLANHAMLGGGILNIGTLTVINSTISGNTAIRGLGTGGAAGIAAGGVVRLINSTVSGNHSATFAGGISAGINVQLQNTIVAGNTANTGPDCSGTFTSLGHNIIGTTQDCAVALEPSDQVGDPLLGDFLDAGSPGNGRFPLRNDSPAIDAGDADACVALSTDQLDTPRRGPCDIGAVEFYPVINDLVSVTNMTTAFDPTPVAGGPAGTFRITAEFTNNNSQPVAYRFAEVSELSGGNLLLNANGGAGGVGARVTTSGSNTVLLPGATETFEFLIGLQSPEPFTFFVNILADTQLNNSFE